MFTHFKDWDTHMATTSASGGALAPHWSDEGSLICLVFQRAVPCCITLRVQQIVQMGGQSDMRPDGL